MFKFDFDLDDILDEQDTLHLNQNVDPETIKTISKEQFTELSIENILEKLPSMISYSAISIPLSSEKQRVYLYRRDLFDARFQLISEDQGTEEGAIDSSVQSGTDSSPSTLDFINAPSDLIPGVYEGGLKTWECSLDLVNHLDSLNSKAGDTLQNFVGKKIIELGCGTGLPSLFILRELLSIPLEQFSSWPSTSIHLQDYNASILELVTLPNLILNWFFSGASTAYRESNDDLEEASITTTLPGELSISSALKDAFLSSLKDRSITLRFFSGSWDTLNLPNMTGSYDILLTSETIYQTAYLPSLVNLMQTCCIPRSPHQPSYLCLVAAKVLYFGVGGSMSDFLSYVAKMGEVYTVWEETSGVARKIVSIQWYNK